MRSDQENKEEREHDTSQLFSESSPDKFDSVRVVVHEGISHLNLSDDVRSVDCDQSKSDAHDHTSDHTKLRESAGNAERSQSNGLDDEADSETFPSQAVEFFVTFLHSWGLVDRSKFRVALFALGDAVQTVVRRPGGVDVALVSGIVARSLTRDLCAGDVRDFLHNDCW